LVLRYYFHELHFFKSMRFYIILPMAFILCGSSAFLSTAPAEQELIEEGILSYVIDPTEGNLAMHYQDDDGETYRSFAKLKSDLAEKGKELAFAMNGGMYMEDRQPLGLYIERGKELRR